MSDNEQTQEEVEQAAAAEEQQEEQAEADQAEGGDEQEGDDDSAEEAGDVTEAVTVEDEPVEDERAAKHGSHDAAVNGLHTDASGSYTPPGQL